MQTKWAEDQWPRKHIKDMHVIQDIQSRPLNHVSAGVWQLEPEVSTGRARTHPKLRHPVPQGHPFSIKNLTEPTGSPQT